MAHIRALGDLGSHILCPCAQNQAVFIQLFTCSGTSSLFSCCMENRCHDTVKMALCMSDTKRKIKEGIEISYVHIFKYFVIFISVYMHINT